ncbi:hypothetical protein [Micromonospora sp. DPT]|uniref:hypothetical protein n=1 Tax=Micromonospora sp. DPT TaxID=3142975 RepID=UPI003208DAC7
MTPTAGAVNSCCPSATHPILISAGCDRWTAFGTLQMIDLGDGRGRRGAGMSRRGGRWTRLALRLGLLLGGVVVAWGAHEAAITATAYAADRPPAAPTDAAIDLLTDVLRPVLDAATPEGRTDDAAAPAVTPLEPDSLAVPPPERIAPSHRAPEQPATRPGWSPTPAARRAEPPARVGTPKPAAEASRPTTGLLGRDALTPTGDALRTVTEPVRSGVLTPLVDALRPVTGPVQADVVMPVTDALRPVTQPLTPILSPVWQGLQPVLEPLDPVLETLEPVTDLLNPPAATPPPTTPSPASPVGGPVPGTGPGYTGPATGPVVAAPARPAAGPDSSSIPPDWHTTTQLSSLPRLAWPGAPHLPWPDADSAPAPGTSGSGASGAVHGNPADALTSVWTPPSVAGRRCHPAGGDALPSRSPRPGTRPA